MTYVSCSEVDAEPLRNEHAVENTVEDTDV